MQARINFSINQNVMLMAKAIASISLGRLNNGAHFEYVSMVLTSLQSQTAVKQKVADLAAAFASAVEAEDAVLKVSTKSLITDDLSQADQDRDTFYAGYKKAVEGFLHMPIADMAQAAKVLNQHIKDYRINTQAQIDKETGLLANFIADLEGKYAAQVTTLGLSVFVTHMKEANERVRTLIRQRVNERMGITIGALRTARTATDAAYHNLVQMVNALALVNGDADYAAFIDYVNAEITRYKREVLNQKASAADTSADSSTSTDTDASDADNTGSGGSSDTGGSGSDSGSQSGGSSSGTGGSSTTLPGDSGTGED